MKIVASGFNFRTGTFYVIYPVFLNRAVHIFSCHPFTELHLPASVLHQHQVTFTCINTVPSYTQISLTPTPSYTHLYQHCTKLHPDQSYTNTKLHSLVSTLYQVTPRSVLRQHQVTPRLPLSASRQVKSGIVIYTLYYSKSNRRNSVNDAYLEDSFLSKISLCPLESWNATGCVHLRN